jgi:hypothetical protein
LIRGRLRTGRLRRDWLRRDRLRWDRLRACRSLVNAGPLCGAAVPGAIDIGIGTPLAKPDSVLLSSVALLGIVPVFQLSEFLFTLSSWQLRRSFPHQIAVVLIDPSHFRVEFHSIRRRKLCVWVVAGRTWGR